MLAVTNTKTFHIIDERTRSLWKVDEDNHVYYGITFTQNRLYVAARQSAYGSDRENQNNVILCFNTRLELEETLQPDIPLRDIHQITIVDDILYVCSTFDDQIGCYDNKTKTWAFWQPFGESEISGRDLHHINSITVTTDEILLSGTRDIGWVARFDKKTRLLKGEKRQLGQKTHNVWLENGLIHICSSHAGSILNEAGQQYALGNNSWTRGYCRDRHYRHIGLSETLIREDRADSDSCIVQCDEDFNILQSFKIEGAGMIHDLRTLDTPDPSHNRTIFALDRDALDAKFPRISLKESLGRFARDMTAKL
ncbi:hypothetical protein H4S14_003293 [Agrobacterium vitis]|nr:hypothetical protein [Agrobacterium vitis]MBE1439528.1 hypothetical protein [Agrobacterium vitis]